MIRQCTITSIAAKMSSASSSVFFNYTVFDRCAVFLIKIATFAFQLFFVIGSHEHDSHILIASLVSES